MRDTDAAKALLYRRAKCLSEFDNANKALDKARAKNKDIPSVSDGDYYEVVWQLCDDGDDDGGRNDGGDDGGSVSDNGGDDGDDMMMMVI